MNDSFEGDLTEIAQRLIILIARYNSELNDYEFINTLTEQKLLMNSLVMMSHAGNIMGKNRELWTKLHHESINQLKHISEWEHMNEQSENRH